MKICSKYGNEHSSSTFETCFRCREKYGTEIEPIKNDEPKKTSKSPNKFISQRELKENFKNIIMSTTHTLDGYIIENYITVESAEVVIGTSFIKDFFASVSDFLGTYNSGYSNTLGDAKQAAFSILKHKALSLGGNAIIGLDIDYIQIGTMMGVIVNGTIVKAKKISSIDNICDI